MQIADKQAKDRKKDESVDERKLTDAEKDKLKKLEKEVRRRILWIDMEKMVKQSTMQL